MSDAPAPSTTPPADPDALAAWAATPEGIAHFARLNQRLMEERLNAQSAGLPGPGVVAVREEAGSESESQAS